MADGLAWLLAVGLTVLGLYGYAAYLDVRFGMMTRRHGKFEGTGWSRWARWGYALEDRRLRRDNP